MTRPFQSWRLIVWVGLLGVGSGASGQGTASPDKYAGEPIVIEKSEAVYRMAADGTGTRLVSRVARIQSEAALREVGVVTIGYASNSEKAEFVYVRSRHADGTVGETPVTEAIEISPQVTQQAPFYSDLKQKQIPVRGLKVGDTLEWQVKVTRFKAEAPGQFWGGDTFTDEAVVLSEDIELHAPKEVAVTIWSPNFKSVESVDGGDRVWRWDHSQLKPTTGPEADAEKEARKKKVWTAEQELDAKEGKLPDIAWTTFKSWTEVGAWYRGLEGERMAPNAEVKAKVAEVTAGKTTQEEKIRAVYSYVATQVRYIGVAFGVGRYQPHEAADVLQNQYGDCKDKHTLLAAMLGVLGLHPDAVLIGAGIRFNEAVPSPASFNHLITRVMVDGKPVWLDTTSEVAPYEMLLAGIRDHSALVIPEAGPAKVEKTPADLPFKAFEDLDATGAINKDGSETARMVLTSRGDDEIYLRAVLRQISPSQWDLLTQKLSEGMGYGGKTSHSEMSRAEDTTEPFKLSYDYKRDKLPQWDTKQVLPLFAPVSLPRVDESEPPVQTLALGIRRVETSRSIQTLPDGWGVELPEAIHAKSQWATLDQTYKFSKGILTAERRVEVLQEKIPVANWKEYKKFCDAASMNEDKYVQLVHFDAPGVEGFLPSAKSDADLTGASASASKKPSNPAAAKLIQEAMNSLQQMDTTAARKQLDDAKALNDEQSRLWLAYGTLENALGAQTAAMAAYEKELALHPNSPAAYGPLAQMQLRRGLRKEAETTLRKWETLGEFNPAASKMLAQMLIEDGDPAAAVAEAKAALAMTPDGQETDEQLEWLLGQAELKAGLIEPGRKTLVDLLQRTDDTGMMNNAAYELANHDLEFPLAEKTARTALDKLEEDSRAWTLDEKPQVLKQKSLSIEAMWDTLGWILYREGKKADGESYIRAAWLNRQSAEVGEHMAQIDLDKGNKDEALTVYELALGTIPSHTIRLITHGNGVSGQADQPPSAMEKELMEKADILRKAGAKPSSPNAQSGLQKLRTISLGSAQGLNGNAEYRVLLSVDKIQRVTPTGDKTLPAGDERLAKTDFKGWMPQGSKAQVVKIVILNCHSGVCEAVVEP